MAPEHTLRNFRPITLVCVASSAVLAGCGGVVADTPRDPSDSGIDATDTTDGAESDARTGSSDAAGLDEDADVVSCSPGPEGVCNTLAPLAGNVPIQCVVGSPPVMTGGTIVDGTYVQTSVTVYATSCDAPPLPESPASTIAVHTQCMQLAADPWAMGSPATLAWTTTGNVLTLTETCPIAAGWPPVLYSADATSLVESSSGGVAYANGTLPGQVVVVYEKR